MSITFLDSDKIKDISKSTVLNSDYNKSLIHQVITSYKNRARSGTKAQKTRGQVSCSTKKLWRQKGTGRARVGAQSNPLWRSGGMIFAAKPRSFDCKVNRKMYRGAIKSIISELIRENRIKLVESFNINSVKTKELKKLLATYGLEKALLVDIDISRELELSSRNIPNILALRLSQVSPVDLVKFPITVITDRALKYFEESLAC